MRKLATLMLAALLAACGNGNSKFEGQWTEVNKGKTVLDITKNGDEYLIYSLDPKADYKRLPQAPLPGVIREGKLVLENGMGKPTFTHVKDNDTLVFASVMGSEEFRRLKK